MYSSKVRITLSRTHAISNYMLHVLWYGFICVVRHVSSLKTRNTLTRAAVPSSFSVSVCLSSTIPLSPSVCLSQAKVPCAAEAERACPLPVPHMHWVARFAFALDVSAPSSSRCATTWRYGMGGLA